MAKDRVRGNGTIEGQAPRRLPHVRIDSNNLKLKDGDGFVGDKARSGAFFDILASLRKDLGRSDSDPLGAQLKKPSGGKIDRLLLEGDAHEKGLVFSAVEEYARQLARVVARFMKQKSWHHTQRIAIGGGMRENRIGELAIGRAAVLLRLDKVKVELVPINMDPDKAGLAGAAYMFHRKELASYDSLLAVDIGGSNIRAGILKLPKRRRPYPAKAKVRHLTLWRHADDDPSREEAYDELVRMLRNLISKAEKEGLELAPLVGVGCPGIIRDDGTIKDGGQNLPGNWEIKGFNLPTALSDDLSEIDGRQIEVFMHNDAVVQGLSQIPKMQDVERWAILTIGTGLGNARFTNRKS